MKMQKTGLMGAAVLAACLHLGSNDAQAVFVGGLNGTSNSSTFETGGVQPLPAEGWTNVSGTARIFDGTFNGSIIGTDAYANYAVEYATGVPVAAQTTYTLHFDMGFVAGIGGGSANYSFELGTLNGSTFTPLAPAETGTVAHSGNMSAGVYSGTDDLVFTTGNTVSGDPLAVRWAQTFQAGEESGASDFFGFDNVTLDAAAVPEPSSVVLLGGLAAMAGFARGRRRKLLKS